MELINTISDRWHSLQTREQRMLLGSAVVIGLLLFYLLIIDPVYSGREDAEQRLRAAQEAFSVMQQQAVDLKASSPTQGSPVSGPLLTLVESSAEKENLRSALKRLQPGGNDQIQVNLEGASYTQIMRWLSNLQHQGVRVQQVDIQIDRNSDLLEVQLLLAR